MANPEFFKSVFDDLAVGGFIGKPGGKIAYCYVRVSTSMQAEEGRTGLPRQIQNIHKAASSVGYAIPWELVFADDHSGFEFENRPELTKLRKEYKSPDRRADAVVMEYLDRLSRNADWHQGFLLDEMKQNSLEVVFYTSFSSRIERAVMGAISQEGMEQAKQRMAEGNIFKAKGGRVTARTPAYGYMLVDAQGNPGIAARKDTHYAPNPDEAAVVKYIFEKVAYDGVSMRSLANELQGLYPPPKKMANWEPRLLSIMIRNPVYKGEFCAHRVQETKILSSNSDGGQTKAVIRRSFRPEEDWIRVSVPELVSKDLWDAANRIISMNKIMSRRNAERPFLLTGLIKCAKCGHSIVGGTKINRKRGKEYRAFWYRCSSRSNRTAVVIKRIGCNMGQVACHILDDAVWSIVYRVLLEPQIMVDALQKVYEGEGNEQLEAQIDYLEAQIEEQIVEDEKLYRAYQADVFDEYEYSRRRKGLRIAKDKLVHQLAELRSQVMTREEMESRKRFILSISERAIQKGLVEDAPFEVKQLVIKSVVNRIVLDVNGGWFRIEGMLSGTWPLKKSNEDGSTQNIVGNPMGRGSWQLQAENWPEKSATPGRG